MKRGRKTKLTRSLLDKLNKLKETKGGFYTDKTLAQIANVHPKTFGAWKAQASTAKAGIFLDFHYLLCDLEAVLEVRIIDSLMDQVDKGNIRAIELAMRRHPHLRKTFREEPAESKTELALLQDKNKDVIAERVEEYWAELKRRRIGPTETEDLINELQERGYEVFKKSDLHAP